MNVLRRAACAALLGASVLLAACGGGGGGGDSPAVAPPPPPPPPPPPGDAKARYVNFTNNSIRFEGSGESVTVPAQSVTDLRSFPAGMIAMTAFTNTGDLGTASASGSVTVAAGEVGLISAFAGAGGTPVEKFASITSQAAGSARVTFSALAYRDNTSYDIYVLAPGTPVAGATPLFAGVTYRANPESAIPPGTYAVTVVSSGTRAVFAQSAPFAILDGQTTAVVMARDYPLKERLLVVNLATATYYPDVRP